MLISKRPVDFVSEVNLGNQLHIGDKAHKDGFHPGFKNRGKHHQKNIIAVSVAP